MANQRPGDDSGGPPPGPPGPTGDPPPGSGPPKPRAPPRKATPAQTPIRDLKKSDFGAVADPLLQGVISAYHDIGTPDTWKTGDASAMLLGEYDALPRRDQIAHLNKLWDLVVDYYPFNVLAEKMVEGHDKAAASQPFVTGWVPGADPKKWERLCFAVGRKVSAASWTDHCIGFRVETTANDLQRVLAKGFTQKRESEGAMGPFKLKGTKADDRTKALFWKGSNDICNETAVCVARNLWGATGFPERATHAKVHLFAIDCQGLKGFDSEAEQIKRNRVWRAGEKAFPFIPPERIVGYVEIERLGLGDGGQGWAFKIEKDTTWTWVNRPKPADTSPVERYLKDVLKPFATGNRIAIHEDYDFYSPKRPSNFSPT